MYRVGMTMTWAVTSVCGMCGTRGNLTQLKMISEGKGRIFFDKNVWFFKHENLNF